MTVAPHKTDVHERIGHYFEGFKIVNRGDTYINKKKLKRLSKNINPSFVFILR